MTANWSPLAELFALTGLFQEAHDKVLSIGGDNSYTFLIRLVFTRFPYCEAPHFLLLVRHLWAIC